MRFRFTLSHDVLGEVEIDPPDGWKGSEITLERHEDFYGLVERYEGAAEGAFIFYGEGGGVNGGLNFIKEVEQTYGFNAVIQFTAELAPDDVNFEEVFTGKLAIHLKNEMPNNRMQVPVIRDDFWTKFISRRDLKVNLSSTTDIDGNEVDPVIPVLVRLTPQAVRMEYDAYLSNDAGFPGLAGIRIGSSGAEDDTNDFFQLDWNVESIREIDEKFTLPIASNPTKPVNIFKVEYGGDYSFDITIDIYDQGPAPSQSVNTFVTLWIQVNEETPVSFSTTTMITDGAANVVVRYTYNDTLTLTDGDQIRIFGTRANNRSLFILYGNQQMTAFSQTIDAKNEINIIGDTIYPQTEAYGYLIHDLIDGVLSRMGLGRNPFYSELFGSPLTNSRVYPSNGCWWNLAVFKGLQIRQFSLTDKPFFTSFNDIWNGVNPILNLGLSFESLGGSPSGKVIRIEQKSHFFNTTKSVNIPNVLIRGSSYDQEHIFKGVTVGYKKWNPTSPSGLSDVHSKRTYNTILTPAGKDLNIESTYIAGIACEIIRRSKKKQTEDHTNDNDDFIVVLNENDSSPDIYVPEQNENFDSVSGLINYDTRYNLVLTPMRNLLRWANLTGGCLQKYTSSSYKFGSGEGNYDMVSDYSCGSGKQCQAIICDSLSEKQDIPLGAPANYNSTFGYLFYPMLYDKTIPMQWEDFDFIRQMPKNAIGISQTTEDYATFLIKSIKYNIMKAEATITAWPREYFDIQVIQGDYNNPACPVERSISTSDDGGDEDNNFDEDYQAILDYAQLQGYTLPSDTQQAIQNQLMLDLKDDGIWDDLDLLYVFATDGDNDFALINWKSPGNFTCFEINSPTFTQNEGFTGNGSNALLLTQWDPATNAVNFTQNEGGAFAYSPDTGTGNSKALFGTQGNGGGALNGLTRFTLRDPGTKSGFGVNGLASTSTANTAAGFYHLRRVASNDLKLFIDGVQDSTTALIASTTLSDKDMTLLALNANGAAAAHTNAKISVFGIGASLTGKESALYNAWNTYFNAI